MRGGEKDVDSPAARLMGRCRYRLTPARTAPSPSTPRRRLRRRPRLTSKPSSISTPSSSGSKTEAMPTICAVGAGVVAHLILQTGRAREFPTPSFIRVRAHLSGPQGTMHAHQGVGHGRLLAQRPPERLPGVVAVHLLYGPQRAAHHMCWRVRRWASETRAPSRQTAARRSAVVATSRVTSRRDRLQFCGRLLR